jgi:hypothetical protein
VISGAPRPAADGGDQRDEHQRGHQHAWRALAAGHWFASMFTWVKWPALMRVVTWRAQSASTSAVASAALVLSNMPKAMKVLICTASRPVASPTVCYRLPNSPGRPRELGTWVLTQVRYERMFMNVRS